MTLTKVLALTGYGKIMPLAKGSSVPMYNWCWKKYKTCRPTDDPAVIAVWYQKFPNCNWAVFPSGPVLDVDSKKGKTGQASIDAAGGLAVTMKVKTPSGGFHYYLRPDPSIPFITRNSFLPGVDIRYGPGGYVVAVGSMKPKGTYEVVISQKSLQDGLLAPSPDWLLPKILERLELDRIKALENKTKPKNTVLKKNLKGTSTVPKCNSEPETPFEQNIRQHLEKTEWKTVRDRVRYLFFRNTDNVKIWNLHPLKTMKDQSQSGYEYQLAIRLANIGASEEEIGIAYRCWCRKHTLEAKVRFYDFVTKAAIRKTALYVEQWKASQPVRMKHGTTSTQILDAIVAGSTSRKAIVSKTGIKGNTVGVQLSRMVKSGKVSYNDGIYAVVMIDLAVAA